ncbi:MAG: phosphonatase-like hydrolase [Corynebacterium sp.]|uniref:phosphonatase-like hydrolase n=1 Tax=unclassified Corynebacterium TaxID=2624378 RepID=UPI0009FB61E7|nr:phosphonatase-like hydrolase [Corynebacterium sp. CNJ-954]
MTLIVCDIAGTTVNEDGIVYRQLRDCVERRGVEVTSDQVNAVKGTEKRSAIASLLSAGGRDTSDGEVAEVFADFMDGLRHAYADQPPRPIDGVEDVLSRLRAEGARIALTTGFQRSIADTVLEACGWAVAGTDREGRERGARFVVDALVTSDTVVAGRPAPYLIHHAMELTGVTSVDDVVSVGDTVADLQAAANAGVRGIGVLTGSVPRETLAAQPHSLILDSLADVPELDQVPRLR